jgi:hypothetical protein
MNRENFMTRFVKGVIQGWLFFVKANVAFVLFLLFLIPILSLLDRITRRSKPPSSYQPYSAETYKPSIYAQDPPKTSVAAARVPLQRDSYSIDQRIVEEDYVQIPMESSKHASIQECQAELDLILPVEAKRLIDTFVLQEVSADKLEQLTQEYILKELFDKTEHRVDSQDTPAGKLYQLQVRMVVEHPQLQQIRSWEQRVITASRVQRLGLISMVVLGCLSIISTTLGLLSKRLETVS